MRPQISDSVHYVSVGTADGQYPAQCNAAIITRVGGEDVPYTVDLYVLIAAQTPPQHGRGGCYHDADINYSQRPTEGTWHYAHDMDHWTTPDHDSEAIELITPAEAVAALMAAPYICDDEGGES